MIITGVVSSVFINLVVWRLLKTVPNHDLKKLTYSDLTHYPQTAKIFSWAVAITAILRMIYFGQIILFFNLTGNYLLITIIYLSLSGMLFTGLIPVNKNEFFHEIASNLMLYLSVIYMFWLHFVINIGAGSGWLLTGRVIFLAQLAGCFGLYFKYKTWGFAEVWTVFMLIVWDLFILSITWLL